MDAVRNIEDVASQAVETRGKLQPDVKNAAVTRVLEIARQKDANAALEAAQFGLVQGADTVRIEQATNQIDKATGSPQEAGQAEKATNLKKTLEDADAFVKEGGYEQLADADPARAEEVRKKVEQSVQSISWIETTFAGDPAKRKEFAENMLRNSNIAARVNRELQKRLNTTIDGSKVTAYKDQINKKRTEAGQPPVGAAEARDMLERQLSNDIISDVIVGQIKEAFDIANSKTDLDIEGMSKKIDAQNAKSKEASKANAVEDTKKRIDLISAYWRNSKDGAQRKKDAVKAWGEGGVEGMLQVIQEGGGLNGTQLDFIKRDMKDNPEIAAMIDETVITKLMPQALRNGQLSRGEYDAVLDKYGAEKFRDAFSASKEADRLFKDMAEAGKISKTWAENWQGMLAGVKDVFQLKNILWFLLIGGGVGIAATTGVGPAILGVGLAGTPLATILGAGLGAGALVGGNAAMNKAAA